MVFEDTYLLIHDADGEEWADGLRFKINENVAFPEMTEKSRLLESGATDTLPSPQGSGTYDTYQYVGEDRGRKPSSGNRGRFWRGRRKRETQGQHTREMIEQRAVNIDGGERQGPGKEYDVETGSSEN
jgi:hypothetical protein